MSIDLTTGCSHSSGKHIYNCHHDCQWCHRSKNDIELEKLRDLIRWRKWPEEKPDTEGRFYVTDDGLVIDWNYFNISSEEWDFDMSRYWRPMGELPKA